MGRRVTSAVASSSAAAAVAGAVAARAAAAPDVVALEVDGGDVLTYGDWEGRSNAVARGLAARGVAAGDRVGLLFGPGRWADFAVAHLGVRKVGAAAALFSPGASPPDLARSLAASGATGLVCPAALAPPGAATWVTSVGDLADAHGTDPPSGAPLAPGAWDDVAYAAAPVAPPAPRACPPAYVGALVDGWLVHTWAPGSPAGQYALQLVLAGPRTQAVTQATFHADRLGALISGRRAVSFGLTPALAAALLASGAACHHDVSSVRQVVVSGSPDLALRVALHAAFPHAEVTRIDGGEWASPGVTTVGDAPAAVSQEGMLWHEYFTPGSFNLPCLVRRYQGRLDVGAFSWALSELVRRHQPLRSTFAVVDGRPRQLVGDGRSSQLVEVDLGGLPPEERDAEVAGVLADATGRPFDLVAGPLFDPRLLRLGPDDHLLVVRLHHTVFDDWSVDVFRRELSALYTARLAGAPSPLAEPEVGFAEWSRREHAQGDGDDGAAQRSWWRTELDGAPLAVQLPLGGDDAEAPGEPMRTDLPPALAAALRALAPTLRATPFMTVLAAFTVLLARVTGQDDLIVATVVAHRNRSDIESLIGCFTKKVPLRLRLDGDPTFAEVVARARASLLGALAHQDVAFEAAVQEGLGRPAADHGVVPQVAVVFQGETPQQVKLALAGLSAGPYEVGGASRRERHFTQRTGDDGRAPEWGAGAYLGTFLILSLLETGEGMSLVARGVFPRLAGRRLLEDFRSVLAEVAANPSRRLSQLRPAGDRSTAGTDVVELRGFRAGRAPMEAALARCAGVADVAVAVRDDAGSGPRLVAYVVAEPGADSPPTLTELRHALWERLPGTPWPSVAIAVDTLPRLADGRLDLDRLPGPDPSDPGSPAAADTVTTMLTAMWGETAARPVTPDTSYWQDFSFLQALAEAREAGVALTDEQVVHCRTPRMLAAALAAASPAAPPVRA